MARTVEISEAECAALIRASVGKGGVRLTFPGGRLMLIEENRWAIAMLAEWRNLNAVAIQGGG